MEIGVLGIGKLGLCFALNIERKGGRVIGVDVNGRYTEALNQKTFHSFEPQVNELLAASKHFWATTEIKEVLTDTIELLFVMVATPSTPEGSYDHTQIEHIAEQLVAFGKRNKTTALVIGCTTMPGYCDDLAQRLAPYNYTVSYNPEFIAQGNIIYGQQFPDQVLIGESDERTGDLIQSVYETMCENKPVFCRMNRLSAEICKIATNCFLTTKISFANSIGDLAVKVGAEPDKILQAIGADSRIGPKYLGYGFGFGGPCFPRDNRALGLFARTNEYDLLISNATDEVNHRHLEFQFQQYLKEYRENEKIIFDGVTYKRGSVMLDESQQLALAVKLAKAGRKVLLRDQQVVLDEVQKLHGNIFEYEAVV